jgi:hypothetical protein
MMIGGPNSFGAGGWANTELEKAMPVDFQIKTPRSGGRRPGDDDARLGDGRGQLLAEGHRREAIKALGPMDYCGLIHWGPAGTDQWLWGGSEGMIRVGEPAQDDAGPARPHDPRATCRTSIRPCGWRWRRSTA